MAWDFSNSKPIFQQITDRIVTDILKGVYRPGDKLASVRELAMSAGVNPNTMQRALTMIEESGILTSQRGTGRFVTEEPAVIEAVRNDYVSRAVDELFTSLRAMGLSEDQITAAVTEKMK